MDRLNTQFHHGETAKITSVSDIVKNVKESHIDIFIDDDGFTENDLASLKRSLKEAAKIKKGELKPLSMTDLWDE